MHTQPWAVQWHSTKMSVRLGQPELVAFLDQRRAHRQRDGDGNGCHVSQTLGWRRAPWKPEGTLYKFVVVLLIFVFSHGSMSVPPPLQRLTRAHGLTGTSVSLVRSVWRQPDRAGPARNDLTKRPRRLRVPKRVVLSEYMVGSIRDNLSTVLRFPLSAWRLVRCGRQMW